MSNCDCQKIYAREVIESLYYRLTVLKTLSRFAFHPKARHLRKQKVDFINQPNHLS